MTICTLKGAKCWDAIEKAARAKRGLGPEFRMCSVDTHCGCQDHNRSALPDSQHGFCRAKVQLGKSVKVENNRDIWYDVMRTFVLTGAEVNAAHAGRAKEGKS